MINMSRLAVALVLALALPATAAAARSRPHALPWHTAVNNGDIAPGGDPAATFRSYNQPAINNDGLIVFRARSSTGAGGMQIDGVYARDLATPGPLLKLLARDDAVPDPNNILYNGLPAAFTEFPSTPRIDPNSSLIATRGQHQPVWSFLLGVTETRIGTSGIYAFPMGTAVTGASLLGSVVELDQITLTFPWYAVPGAQVGTRFDQFPGSPAVLDNRYIVYKGNYTDLSDGVGRTGIYFRDVVSHMPIPYTGLIANSNMLIPNQPPGSTVKFGSTAPPSAANGYVFFTGLDVEAAPTLGGIYRAPIGVTPTLQTLVGIGDQVPGEAPGTGFRAFGEGLSVSSDGQQVSFWASWGTETFPKLLLCPTDGNPDLIVFCNEQHPAGLLVDIPVNQGIFAHNAGTGETRRIARTGIEGIGDFLFWVFSGRPPGVGGSIEPGTELARWRSSAFSALSVAPPAPLQIAFKAERNALQGVYLRQGFGTEGPLQTVAEVGTTPGTEIDPLAPAGSLVSAVGVERDGFRNGRLAITASMLYVDPVDPDVTIGWAGIYDALAETDFLFGSGFED
jgi:hypothetical protein